MRRCRRLHDNKGCGVEVFKAGGHLKRCELWGNADGGVCVSGRGDPTLAACIFRDHVKGKACGVYVDDGCNVAVGADCVFARNAKGGVVRAREGGPGGGGGGGLLL